MGRKKTGAQTKAPAKKEPVTLSRHKTAKEYADAVWARYLFCTPQAMRRHIMKLITQELCSDVSVYTPLSRLSKDLSIPTLYACLQALEVDLCHPYWILSTVTTLHTQPQTTTAPSRLRQLGLYKSTIRV